MDSQTSARQPRKHPVDQMLLRTIVRLCAVVEIIGIASIAALRYFEAPVSPSLVYSILIIVILAIGFIYCLLGWQSLQKHSPAVAINLAILPLSVAILLATLSTGGLSSPWFLLFLVMIMVSGLAGTQSVLSMSGLTLVLLGAYVFTSETSISFSATFTMQVSAILFALGGAYLIGRAIDRMIDIMKTTESLTQQFTGSGIDQQMMLSSIADTVVGVDSKLNVVIFNAAAQKVTGWDEKSAKGIHYNLIFKLRDQNDAELSPATDPFMQAIQSGKQLSTDHFYMLNKDNQKISFSIAIAPTKDIHGEVNGAVAVFHDVSEQKAVARERNEFISTASHEMRTPVAAIEGYLAMALNPKLAEIDERAKNFIGKAHEASVHLGKLFRDLLSVTKIEDRRLTIKIGRVNLTDLLRSVVTEMEIIAKAKNITIDSPFTRATDAGSKLVVPAYEVHADPDRMREVISNLIDNAIKYSRPSSTVTINISTDQNFAKVSIADSGIGISAEDQKHLFQKFYRVNNSYTREVGGTGLGLYIARNLIELFGGKIWLDSAEGKGSTFYFTLPLEKHQGL